MKSLIIGKGQVGQSLYEVLKDSHEVYIKDLEDLDIKGIEVLHLCFPYTDKFVEQANGYIDKYKPLITINHASVKIGTTEFLTGNVCYSPIRGKHPNLAKDIRTFDKFIAGKKYAVEIADKYFKECGLNTVCFNEDKIRDLEFCKLMSNIRYGYEIAFFQEAERLAKTFNVSIDTFKLFEASYNYGYGVLGQSNMVRPILFGGIIGGHCVMHNADLIDSQSPSEMIDWIRFSNTKKIVEVERGEK